MEKCYDCEKMFEREHLELLSNNGNSVQLYCNDCGGFPTHEYRVTCPNCEIEILVN